MIHGIFVPTDIEPPRWFRALLWVLAKKECVYIAATLVFYGFVFVQHDLLWTQRFYALLLSRGNVRPCRAVAEAQEVGFVVEHDVELEAFSFDLKLAALEHREVGLDLAELVLVVEDLVAVVCGHHMEQLNVVGLVLDAEDVVKVGIVGQLGDLEFVVLASFDDSAT